jgi:hypothetical protein
MTLRRYPGGSVPYGYRLEHGRLMPEFEEMGTIALVRQWRKQGLTLRAIADRLAQCGRLTRTGAAWHPQQIERMMRP